MSHSLKIVFALLGYVGLMPVAIAQFATVINVPPSEAPSQIDSNTQLNLFNGGSLAINFNAGNPDQTSENVELNLFDGAIASGLDVYAGATVNISGGTIGDDFGSNIFFSNIQTFPGSEVNISGGIVGAGFLQNGIVNLSGGVIQAGMTVAGGILNITGGRIDGLREAAITDASFTLSNGTVNLAGGILGDFASTQIGGSVFNITGGILGENFFASNSANQINTAVVNISGGTIRDGFQASNGSQINLVGTDFAIDGIPVDGLSAAPTTITQRNVTLSGNLEDGTPIEFDLNSTDLCPTGRLFSGCSEDFFAVSAELTLRLPDSVAADFTNDGNVNGADLVAWENSYGTNDLADSDADNDTDGADFLVWQRGITASAANITANRVPEANTILLALIALPIFVGCMRT